MTTTTAEGFATGLLVFIGPAQVPALTELYYARVDSVGETTARLSLVDPDGADEEFAEEVSLDVLRRRAVSQEESELWPGSYVGHPIAFIQPDGPTMDQWAFGLVTGYRMADTVPWLHIRHENGVCNVVGLPWLTTTAYTYAHVYEEA
ncbi:hypothetical protein PHYSODRAFT_342413 [Phytophthora sojae]|uniref:Uncharacterized protein n=1 Tax=Phytophthora sojae (strain P6497) TaxID=1094619 RepID=G5AGB1_PHYSP|nr:hypothetical protein PHYSODRAFT_342413 [Phytophthora sojae]EGZ05623.1 hypothetical protein PHYSODRAFT_342413 [Phytophthora sojae]|eukprot:XP_009539154.1 hypothetical protein PHYSODRAFT_342413 [Phytophthora sojae]